MTQAVIDTMVFAYALFNELVHRQEAVAVLEKAVAQISRDSR
ncbi:hypothetical protein [Endozoicomonas acroporae]